LEKSIGCGRPTVPFDNVGPLRRLQFASCPITRYAQLAADLATPPPAPRQIAPE
jgi:hypothetical protein